MPVLLHCLFVASLIPTLTAWVGGYLRMKQFGRIDNHHPRLQQAQLTGIGARAMAAQANGWEALMMFATAVLIAHAAGANLDSLAVPGLLFVALRVAYVGCYLANLATPRSLVYLGGAGCCFYIVWQAAHVAA